MALYIHAQNGPGVGPGLLGSGGQLDASRLSPATHLDLGLDYDRVANPVGPLDDLVGGHRYAAGRHGYPEAGEVLLTLVFEQVHGLSLKGSGGPSNHTAHGRDRP